MFAIWLLITVFGTRLIEPAQQQELSDMVAARIAPGFVMAVAFLSLMVWVLKWRDLGLNAPTNDRWLRLCWLPGLFIIAFAALSLLFGLPPAHVLLFVFINTCLVGISEELACRGFLLQGLRSAMSLWPAIILAALLFGGMHIFNGFLTGNFGAAALQSVAAAMSGTLFIALRLRTGSLYPPMIIHALWDFGVFTMSQSMGSGTPAAAPSHGNLLSWATLFPVIFVTPNFLYGLYLLRNISRDVAEPAPGSASAVPGY